MLTLVDASGADGAGLGRYVLSMVRAWSALGLDDLHVLCRRSMAESFAEYAIVHRSMSSRFERQVLLYRDLPALVDRLKPDAVLLTLPLLPLRRLPAVTVAVVHDLRHELRAKEFTLARRILRRLEYGRAYRRADQLVAISERTRRDLIARYPQVAGRVSVVHHGVDAAEFASEGTPRTGLSRALAFAHHPNKRPELAVRAWINLYSFRSLPTLTIVGAPPRLRQELLEQARISGLPPGLLDIRGTLDDAEYRRLWSEVEMVILPSGFEGFGLPVLEALARGVAAITSRDAALVEVGAGHTFVVEEESPAGYAAQVAVALENWSHERRVAAMTYARQMSWARTAEATREALLAAIARAGP